MTGHPLMKTKDEGTAWLRSHGWVLCERGWVRAVEARVKPGEGV